MTSAPLRILAVTTLAAAMSLSVAAWAAGSGGGGNDNGNGGDNNKPKSGDQGNLGDQNYSAALALFDKGDYAGAAAAFDDITAKNPRNADAWVHVGYADRQLGISNQAKMAYETAAKLEPGRTDAVEPLGELYMQSGDRKAAREQLSKLAQICGTGCGAYQDLALVLTQNSLSSAKWAESSDPAYTEAVRLIHAKDYAKAKEALTALVAREPNNADAWNYIGFSSRMMGQYDDSLTAYKKALAIRPDHVGANEYLGELYAQTGHTDLARAQLAKLETLCGKSCEQYQDLAAALEGRPINDDDE